MCCKSRSRAMNVPVRPTPALQDTQTGISLQALLVGTHQKIHGTAKSACPAAAITRCSSSEVRQAGWSVWFKTMQPFSYCSGRMCGVEALQFFHLPILLFMQNVHAHPHPLFALCSSCFHCSPQWDTSNHRSCCPHCRELLGSGCCTEAPGLNMHNSIPQLSMLQSSQWSFVKALHYCSSASKDKPPQRV